MKLASIFGRGEEFPGANHTNDQPAQKNSIILTVDLVEIARPVAAIFPYLELLAQNRHLTNQPAPVMLAALRRPPRFSGGRFFAPDPCQ